MNRMKISLRKSLKAKLQKGLAFKLVLIILLECAWPTASMALTGGPSQPEVQSFEPVGVSDMVDLFSGDFSYNIPLFEVDGYPMNLSYHSGIGMDQEASWVGLGWNINAGVINRGMRGLPDDFSGDVVTKEQNVKKNQTIGVSGAFSGELFGLDNANFTARLGVKYNNYTGVGVEKSFNVSISASGKYGGTGSVGLGITSSSDDGLSLAPSISLGVSTSKSDNKEKVGATIGASFNSRGGLSSLSIAPDISQSFGNKGGALSRSAGGWGSIASAKFNFGQQTYSPNLDFPMENLSVTANFKLGLEAWGFAGSVAPGAYYMEQGQTTKIINSPAFGYMNVHNGQNNPRAMMDFNREKDGSFNKSTYNLPITNLTYDIYSVSGQGTSGSYRPFRSDIGHVFDNESFSTSDGYVGGVELGAGGLFKGGVDISVNSAYSHSGDWSSSKAAESMSYVGTGPNPDYEPWYFKEANEKSVNSDVDFLKRYGGFNANRFSLDGSVNFDTKTTGKMIDNSGAELEIKTANQRKSRDKRNQTITVLNNREVYEGMGLFGVNSVTKMNLYIKNNIGKLGHHIGQITSMNTDGRRYVYTLPVYNKEQQEVTFAVGKPVGGGAARTNVNGIVTYKPGQDNSTGNKMGLDNYYSNTKMPPFAHSYMLSAVLSSDYVDVSGDGPSDDDLGNYVLFSYIEQTPNYNWRTPCKKDEAKYNQGLMADENDDKGSYVYGVKQLYYLDKITTKNQEAKFNLLPRQDGKGVLGKDGGINTNSNQYKIDNIVLKSKTSNIPIKTVHFVYTYDLCGGSENSTAGGKLTLKQLYFTYRNSEKGAFNSYDFSYNEASTYIATDNQNYNQRNYDRWGNYKTTNPIAGNGPMVPMDYFPYTNQDPSNWTQVHQDAAMWNLKEIKLPSGGKIKIDYESDDYAFVQNKQATQMYLYESSTPQSSAAQSVPANFIFKFKIPSTVPMLANIGDFLPDNNMVFFKFRMLIDPIKNLYDYVPGYAEIDRTSANTVITGTSINNRYGQIAFKQVNSNDHPNTPGNVTISPFVKAALQFGRLNTPRIIWDQPNASASLGTQVVKALLNSNFATTAKQAALGPNGYLHSVGKAQKADLTASWIKLKNVDGRKYGGGCRVKKIILNDDFSNMTGEADSEYGQVYTYTTLDSKKRTISSGVASYEPQIGGEENALKEPFFTEAEKLLAPDDEHYAEAPFGECFYPSASVGYSCVRVENYYPTLGSGTMYNRKTGWVDNEFYTAKDFPTITERTGLEAIEHKTDPVSLNSLFNIKTKNHMTASQGFYVELNDMHGKPKATRTYNYRSNLIASTEYFYKSEAYGGSRRLVNKVLTIAPNGGTASSEIGVFFDAVGDLREQTTETETDGLNVNTDIIQAAFPIASIVPIPSFASDKTQFRSAVITKVVQRFGILDKTISKQDGSTVTSSDLAYDAESGEVLLTQTINGFNDPVFNFKYPAYWYYDKMGAAYKNISYTQQLTFNAGVANLADGYNMFVEGDEVELQSTGNPNSITYQKQWVTKVKKNSITLQNMAGAATLSGTYVVKILRSGRRNMQTMEMASIQTMVNPLSGVRSNIYQKVVSSKATEYSNSWNINCECLTQGTITSGNPYIQGALGNWRTKKSYSYISQRTQANSSDNSNLRSDGFFSTYAPFYKNSGGRWKISPQDWTFKNDITEYGPTGQELENINPLYQYSSASFGFNQTLATAVTTNSKYKEQAYLSCEDNPTTCTPDKHFLWESYGNGQGVSQYTSADSHTGKNSIEIYYLVSTAGISSCGTGRFGITKPITTNCTRPTECPGTIEYDFTLSSYVIKNGLAPYKLSVEKIQGDGMISINPDGTSFKVVRIPALSSVYKCNVTVTDARGCMYTKLIKTPYNN